MDMSDPNVVQLAALLRQMSAQMGQGGDGSDTMLQQPPDDAMAFAMQVAARREAGPPPVLSCRLMNRDIAARMHVQRVREHEQTQQSAPTGSFRLNVRQTMAAPLTHGVAPPLAGLAPITLAQTAQRVNAIWTGRVLFVRTALPALREVGTSLFVEDSAGDVATASLYNFVRDDQDPSALFPVGTRLALLEPYMRHARDNPVTGMLMLRCDNPQAVLIFDDARSWEMAQAAARGGARVQPAALLNAPAGDADALCERGNAAFKAGRDEEAHRLYSAALQLAPGSARAHGNRAAVLVRMERWADALADAEAALREDPGHTKCRLRAATALLCLQRVPEAHAAAEALLADAQRACSSAPAGAKLAQEARTLFRDMQRALAEHRGVYDMTALALEASACGSVQALSRRHADYESPVIKVVAGTAGKGRRVVAQNALPASTLVMAAKAFVFMPGGDALGNHLLAVGDTSASSSTGTNAVMLPAVIHTLLAHPERGTELYSLSGGAAYAAAPDLSAVAATRVDVKRISAILGNNWFSTCADEAAEQLAEYRWAVSLRRAPTMEEREKRQAAKQYRSGTGLWVRPALFNHSCAPNCVYRVVGDFMFIITTRPIAAEEELCVPYCCPTMPYEERTAVFAKWNSGDGFVCDCVRCELCRQQPAVAVLETEISAAHMRAMSFVSHVADPYENGALEAAVEAAMPRARRRAARTRLESLPLPCQASLCQLLDMEAGADMSAHRFGDALAAYQRTTMIRASVVGTDCGMLFQPLKDQLRVAAAAVVAQQPGVARAAMQQAVDGAVTGVSPWGNLSKAELLMLIEGFAPAARAMPALRQLANAAVAAAQQAHKSGTSTAEASGASGHKKGDKRHKQKR